MEELLLPALATAASSGRNFITAYCIRHGVSPTAAAVQPQLRTEWTDGTTGRGVMIMDALAQRWGVFSHPAGKSIWFELKA